MSHYVEIEGVTYCVCFDWNVRIKVRRFRKNRKPKEEKYTMTALGGDPNWALFSLKLDLEKKKWVPLQALSIECTGVGWAFDMEPPHEYMERELRKTVQLWPAVYICDACYLDVTMQPGLRCKRCTQTNKF